MAENQITIEDLVSELKNIKDEVNDGKYDDNPFLFLKMRKKKNEREIKDLRENKIKELFFDKFDPAVVFNEEMLKKAYNINDTISELFFKEDILKEFENQKDNLLYIKVYSNYITILGKFKKVNKMQAKFPENARLVKFNAIEFENEDRLDFYPKYGGLPAEYHDIYAISIKQGEDEVKQVWGKLFENLEDSEIPKYIDGKQYSKEIKLAEKGVKTLSTIEEEGEEEGEQENEDGNHGGKRKSRRIRKSKKSNKSKSSKKSKKKNTKKNKTKKKGKK